MQNTSLECEKCGGELQILEDGVTAVCRFCRHKTVWKETKSDALIMALNRANKMRRSNRFSEAIQEYKVITDQNPDDAEAWWGLTLSTYGIEYVQDPRTGNPVPTCHRTITGSILKDSYYLKAQENAQSDQRKSYLAQAQEIDRLQQEIKRKMDEEEDFDVFISFKATGPDGERTSDSYLARRIYDELTKRDIKTFFSDVTLHGKIADDFEPIIYRALFSCKFFVLVGTSAENINATWVKNEWSRFEKRMEDEKLSGVACAVFDSRKVSVRELPPFLRTQGVDLKNYQAGGYEIDIADTVEKKTGRSMRKEEERRQELLKQMQEAQLRVQREFEEKLKNVASGGGGASETVTTLLTCAEQELAAGEFDNASDYFKQVRNRDPMNDSAWWGFFLVEFGAKHEDELLKIMDSGLERKIEASRNFKAANQYLSDVNKERVNGFISKMHAPGLWWGLFLKEMQVSDEMELCGKNISSKIINKVKNSENYKNAVKYADDVYRARIEKFNDRLESPESNWTLFLKDHNVTGEAEILRKISAELLTQIENNACYKNARQRATGELRARIDSFDSAIHSSGLWWKLFLKEFRVPSEKELLDNFAIDLEQKIERSNNFNYAVKFSAGDAEYSDKIAAFKKQMQAQKEAYNEGAKIWDEISAIYKRGGRRNGQPKTYEDYLDKQPEYARALELAEASHVLPFFKEIISKGCAQRNKEESRIATVRKEIKTAQKCRAKLISCNVAVGLLCIIFSLAECLLAFIDVNALLGLTGNGFVNTLLKAFSWENMSVGIKIAFALTVASGIALQIDLAVRQIKLYNKDNTTYWGTAMRVRALICQLFFFAIAVAAQYAFYWLKPLSFGLSLGIAQYGAAIIIALGFGTLWVKYRTWKVVLAYILVAAYHAFYVLFYTFFPMHELSAWMEIIPLVFVGVPLLINLIISVKYTRLTNIILFIAALALLASCMLIIWFITGTGAIPLHDCIITVEDYFQAVFMVVPYLIGGVIALGVIITVVVVIYKKVIY